MKKLLIFISVALIQNYSKAQSAKDTINFVTNYNDPRLLKYKDSLNAYNIGIANLKKMIVVFNQIADTNCSAQEQKIHPYSWRIAFVSKTSLVWAVIQTSPTYSIEDSLKYSINGIKPFCKLVMIYNESGASRSADSREILPYYKEPVREFRYLAPLGCINISGREIKYYMEYEREEILRKCFIHKILLTQTRKDFYTTSRYNETTYWGGNILYSKNSGEVFNLSIFKLAH